jgi:hypothetical protein
MDLVLSATAVNRKKEKVPVKTEIIIKSFTDNPHLGAEFSRDFLDYYGKVSFGAIGKRDFECLLLYLLLKHGLVSGETNRELANVLEINETKLKAYLVDIHYKFEKDSADRNVHAVIQDILVNRSKKMNHENGYFIFSVENPVQRIDFEQAMKNEGFYTDTSFNREIVKVKDYALFAFLNALKNKNDDCADFAKLIKLSKENREDLENKLKNCKTPRERWTAFAETAGKGLDIIVALTTIAVNVSQALKI